MPPSHDPHDPQAPQDIAARLTLDDWIDLIGGASFWRTHGVPGAGLPPIHLADGPHGLRKQPQDQGKVGPMDSVPATCFPTAAAMACSWDLTLLDEVGHAMGREARDAGVSVLLGPGLNIKRHPHCGRNFEYFSEDPFLSGKLAAAMIQGIQRAGVGACPKHFIANNQEHHRQIVDVIIDPRALHEIYLTVFAIAIQDGQPWAIMAAYNKLNGDYCCEHQALLQEILRERWGFEGLVISDWGATSDRSAALRAGLDLEMPGNKNAHKSLLLQALTEGSLAPEDLERAATRVIDLLQKAKRGQISHEQQAPHDPAAHHALAVRAAAASVVLLKHDPALLPLPRKGHIAVIGEMAMTPRIQGNGSSRVVPTRVDSPWEALWAELQGDDVALGYARGYERKASHAKGLKLREEALQVADQAAITLLFLGLHDADESEGVDRKHLDLPPAQLALLDAIAALPTKVIVILSTGAPVAMPWVDKVQAILTGYLGGQGYGKAIAGVLLGHHTPCGKLAETFPLEERDCPATRYFPGSHKQVQYRESIYVGYRYYDSFARQVRFPFGHGLSYTSFAYSQPELSHNTIEYKGHLAERACRISSHIKNTGAYPGAEIVQLYAHFPDSPVQREEQALKGFAKVVLEPGESKVVRFSLAWHQLAIYDAETSRWQVPQGPCELRFASSSRDIRLRATLDIQSRDNPTQRPLSHAVHGASLTLSEEDFAALLGYPVPTPAVSANQPLHVNSTFGEAQRSWLGRILFQIAKRAAKSALKGEEHDAFREAVVTSLEGTPLRSMVLMSEGKVRFRHLRRLLGVMNRKW